ncbi:hypothetical protein FSP39_005821 [Pinctada imbricata]|uniref:RZ-type domain-containing protein n=1 Tax=Pinctada imbricata TaxID=66713 RepID=A0AA88YUG5_PINIB|nr:hypothetical protein FSP39_005821 [Pinctada imbricata]
MHNTHARQTVLHVKRNVLSVVPIGQNLAANISVVKYVSLVLKNVIGGAMKGVEISSDVHSIATRCVTEKGATDHATKKNPTCGHPCVGLCGETCPRLCWICNREELTEIFFGTEDEPDARFVQLVDCGHVFEVTGLDTYIDGLVSTEQSEATTEIVFISCPRCKTPIKRSFRYGNIIKSIKRDIEKVKKSMNNTDRKRYNISMECEQLLFSVVQCTIDKQLTKTLELFMNIEKTEKFNVSYTRTLKGLLNQLHKHVLKIYQDLIKKNRSVVFESRPVLQQIVRLAEWISQKRIVFSQFELEQFSMELRRLRTLIMFYILQQDCQRNKTTFAEGVEKIDEAINELGYPKTNSNEVLEKYADLHSELRKEIPRNCLGISENEKIEILKAMDLKKGQWYKCKNGHVYCIGECGGAMEKSKCPECGDVIGGERHTLTEGNRLAREMDGATYAAWSEEANNMANFDMQDLL